MLNKNWSSLNDEHNTGALKRVHFGKYFAEMQFILYGFEVYTHPVNDRRIDFIIRNQNGVFFDVKVASIPTIADMIISSNKFDIKHESLYFVVVHFVEDGKDPEMYILPYAELLIPYKDFDPTKYARIARFGFRRLKSNLESLQEYKFETYVEVIKGIKME